MLIIKKFMKKIKFSILVLVSFFVIISCTNENIDKDLKIPVTNQNIIQNPNDPANPIIGELFITNPSNDYFPMAVLNNWNYETKTSTNQLKLTSYNLILGLNYFKTNQPIIDTKPIGDFSNENITTYIRKINGDYFQKMYINRPEDYSPAEGNNTGVSVRSGIIIQPFEFKFFKESVPVGDSFTETVMLEIDTFKTVTFPVNLVLTTQTQHVETKKELIYTTKILEKKENQFVNKIRTTVIKSKLTNNLNGDITYYWFAKNIGLLRQSNQNSAEVVNNFLELKTFNLF